MLFTERKALEEMFSYLEEDKRTIKAQARLDIENIENRQMQILDRLQRLDSVERETIDVEGVLHQLAATTTELSKLIPEVPFTDALERAAEIIAEKDRERGFNQVKQPDPGKEVLREKLTEAARVQQVTAPPGKKPAKRKSGYGHGITKEKGSRIVEEIIKTYERPLRATEVQKQFEDRTGVIYANFHAKIKEWAAYSKGRIVKEGKFYKLKEPNDHDQRTNERTETKEEATV